MGQVFRARDTKLDRDIALKILPEAFAYDADRLARFTRDAKTLPSLNHPNIAHIHAWVAQKYDATVSMHPRVAFRLKESEITWYEAT